MPVDDQGQILPFQMLARRLKVYEEDSHGSMVVMFIFDIMYYKGHCLMDLPFCQRRAVLRLLFRQSQLVRFAQSVDISGETALMDNLAVAVQNKTEGLIVKELQSRYVPDRRSRHWLKLKKDYMDGVGDSLDLVPIAGWYGMGKRAGFVGSYLLACADGSGGYETVTQVGTGFSDDFLAEMTRHFEARKEAAKPRGYKVAEQYLTKDTPDFWIGPDSLPVWEIKVANLSLSLTHTCGAQLVRDKEGRGIAARLPRFIRCRDDKTADECSTN